MDGAPGMREGSNKNATTTRNELHTEKEGERGEPRSKRGDDIITRRERRRKRRGGK